MHRPLVLAAALTFVFALPACSGGDAEDHSGHDHAAHAEPAAPAAEPAAPAAEPAAPADEHSADSETALILTLDDGAKWPMDEHTRTAFGAMRGRLDEAKPTSVQEYVALGAALQSDIDGLIVGCTMRGPAHDQLHVFLRAYIPAVQVLKGTTDAADGQRNLEHLRALARAYDIHFE
jgi:hypothetical protein